MRLKGLLFVGSMAVLGVAFTSCSKGEELYDSGAIVAQQKSEYATNFEKKVRSYRSQSDLGLSYDAPHFQSAFNQLCWYTW